MDKGTQSKIDTTILDEIIVGRVEPYIYAFSTETVPNYLKVGDTSRGVQVRLNEWRKIFHDLIPRYEHSAQIDEDTIFRDFAVHSFLERDKGLTRLQKGTFDNQPYSQEFFKNATAKDVDDAIADIIKSAREKSGKYPLFSADRLPKKLTYARTENYALRDNQQQVVDNFKAAVAAGRTKLLLYAVMRFGKSFTSMCCANAIDARFVVIVSAKADVKEEWKKTVESHTYFADYTYLNSKSLKQSDTIIANTLANPKKKVALCLTLQDLQGNDIKAKHKEVFERQIDLLIIDETHFGARGASYGKVLREQRLSKSEIHSELKAVDELETLDKVKEAVKTLKAKIRLHLSGTPYRILMSDEFQKEDIIAFVQFTDIIDAQQQWYDENLKKDNRDEWENPYYGFPQMIRFAFNPNESSRKIMEQMRKDGVTYALSELLRPLSMATQTDGSHRLFKHETEILDLLEVIDGSKDDENLLGFLDYDKIKVGKMCRHIVCVLPFRASCDAMAALIRKNRNRFKNLGDYEIINIAGFDEERKYKSVRDVKRTITELENNNRKSLTLTVNRMLTGTTMPQWDTMLYLKGTASPQEYDQAIFRLQNQYITTYKEKSGKIVKYNMKPQTLLVDFDPNRMFILQELKSQFYNVNKEVQGNAQLRERIAKELKVSPIIVMNSNKLQLITPTNVTDAVREYSRTRSILDDASEIPADYNLLQNDSLAAILRTIEPINAKNGLQIKPTEGQGANITPGGITDASKNDTDNNDASTAIPQLPKNQKEEDNLEKRLAAYYARILFFAFLTESTVKSLEDVITQIPATDENRRIANNLGLDVSILKLIQHKSNPSALHVFDFKIENTNDMMRDYTLQPIKRVEVALNKFGRLSDSEIVTPTKIADEMVSILPVDELNAKKNVKFLDIAAKQGEFTIALYKKFGEKVKKTIYAIPTSTLTYEFTRKVYVLLGMPVENVFADFTSYELIGKNNEKIIKKLTDMKFDVAIGNPPYQTGKVDTSDDPIYNCFYDVSFHISPRVSLITPARFLFNAGKTPKNWNNKMLKDAHFKVLWHNSKSSDVFPDVVIMGGIAIGYRDAQEQYGGIHVYTPYQQLNTLIKKVSDYGYTPITKIFYAQNKFNLESLYADYPNYRTRIGSNGRERRLTTSIFALTELFSDQPADDEVCVLGLIKNQRIYRYVKRKYIEEGGNLDFYKVIVPKSNGSGAIGADEKTPIIGEPMIGEPHTGVTQSFISFGKFATKDEAISAHKYIRSKFARTLLGILKVTQDNNKDVWRYVPLQDFTTNSDIDWSKSVAEIDAQLYAKYNLSDEEIAFIESMIKPM